MIDPNCQEFSGGRVIRDNLFGIKIGPFGKENAFLGKLDTEAFQDGTIRRRDDQFLLWRLHEIFLSLRWDWLAISGHFLACLRHWQAPLLSALLQAYQKPLQRPRSQQRLPPVRAFDLSSS